MSLDTEHAMARNAQEVLDILHGPHDEPYASVEMPFSIAIDINSKLSGIVSMADALHEERKGERRELLEIIEGLLSNWPTTESVGHYMPQGSRAVLMKDEALKRAGRVVRELT